MRALAIVSLTFVCGMAGIRPGSEAVAAPKNPRVRAVFAAIQNGTYSTLPTGVNDIPAQTPSPFAWTDIPDLLALADDTTRILKPVSPASSFDEPTDTIEKGAVALWLIEGIRINRRYPRMHVLMMEGSDPDLKKRAQAYRDWWKRAMRSTPEAAAAKNPLDGTGLRWN